MKGIQLCITSVIFITLVFSDQSMNQIRVFPAVDQSIAGVIHVCSLNNQSQQQYAFNVSEARTLCQSLGLNIASKAQVEKALRRGLETCRFGWTDEQVAVIPRIRALANCGNNQIGLVPWRASITKKFDVFCFNKSDAETQLMITSTDNSLTFPHSEAVDLNSTPHISPTLYPLSEKMDNDVQQSYSVSSASSSSMTKAVLISCTCGILLMSIATVAFLKRRRCSTLSIDTKQQEHSIQASILECATSSPTETKVTLDDTQIEMEDNEL